MDVKEAIKTRRTIRTFDETRPIPQEIMEELFQAAIYAPSACNKQGWKFLILSDPEARGRLVHNFGSPTILTAPTVALVLYRKDVSHNQRMYSDHIQSASAAIQNLLLLAHDRGVGGCWICHLPPKRVIRTLFRIPRQYEVVACVALGYPKEYLTDRTKEHYFGNENMAHSRTRLYDHNEVVCHNTFREHYDLKKVQSHLLIKQALHDLMANMPRCRLQLYLERKLSKALFFTK